MSPHNLIEQADEFRTQAKAMRGAERRLLLAIADAFEDKARWKSARSLVEASRCW